QGSGGGLCHATGREHLSLLDTHHASYPGPERGAEGTPQSTSSSAIQEARASGHRAQSSLDMGYHEAVGSGQWTYFHLYVILDIFSRNVVGWMVAGRETAELAKRLIAATCEKQAIAAGTLTIHADRGTSMTSKPVALMLADLGVTKTHSRPPMSQTTTHTRRASSRLSNTGPSSPSDSVPSRTHAPFVSGFFPGTTTNTITAESRC